MNENRIIQRIDRLEQKLGDLERKIGKTPANKRSWRDFIGMFHNDPYFKKAVEAGAAYRRSLRPGNAARKPRKT